MSVNSSDANRQEDYDPWATPNDPDDPDYNPDTGKLIELPVKRQQSDGDWDTYDPRLEYLSDVSLSEACERGISADDEAEGKDANITPTFWPSGTLNLTDRYKTDFRQSSRTKLQKIAVKHGLAIMSNLEILKQVLKLHTQLEKEILTNIGESSTKRIMDSQIEMHFVNPFNNRTSLHMLPWCYSKLSSWARAFGFELAKVAVMPLVYSYRTEETYRQEIRAIEQEIANFESYLEMRLTILQWLND